MLRRRSVRTEGIARARSSWLIMPVDRPVRLATSWIEKPARWRRSRTVSPRRWSTASSFSIVWAFFGTLAPLPPPMSFSRIVSPSNRFAHITKRRLISLNNRVIPSTGLTRLFSCDEIYIQIVRGAEAQSISPLPDLRERGAGDSRARKRRGLMADETGKFDIPALGNLTPGIPNRRQFMLLGASAAAGMTVPASAFAQTERPTNPPDKPRGQVIAALSQEPTVFHPLMPGIEVDQGVWWQVFSPLWFIDPDGNFVPDLAREVPTIENGGLSADGLTWKIKLRSDAKWHDGTAFTAEDVKFSLELINNPDFRARNRVGHNLIKDIKVDAPDEIHWRMEAPYSPYMSILSLTCMVPKHILEKVSDPNSSPFHNAPVGTGPFRWGERVPGDHILLNAHAAYHGKGPYLERVVFKYIPDLTVLYTQFRTGQVDYTGLQGILPNFVQEAKTLRGCKIFVSSTARCVRRFILRSTRKRSSMRSITVCRRRPRASCRSRPGRSSRACRSTATIPRRQMLCSMRPDGSAAQAASARRAA